MILHFSHMGFTEGLTFICFTSYLLLQVMRPRVRSYGDICTVTLSPGSILMKFILSFPEIWARIV